MPSCFTAHNGSTAALPISRPGHRYAFTVEPRASNLRPAARPVRNRCNMLEEDGDD